MKLGGKSLLFWWGQWKTKEAIQGQHSLDFLLSRKRAMRLPLGENVWRIRDSFIILKCAFSFFNVLEGSIFFASGSHCYIVESLHPYWADSVGESLRESWPELHFGFANPNCKSRDGLDFISSFIANLILPIPQKYLSCLLYRVTFWDGLSELTVHFILRTRT